MTPPFVNLRTHSSYFSLTSTIHTIHETHTGFLVDSRNVSRYRDSVTDWQAAQVARIGAAIRALRGEKSVQWIADVTAEIGVPIGRSTIADIELTRRKYVAVHEVSVIAAALGVTPSVLLTWGDMPDGQVDVLPGRGVDGLAAMNWWGGVPLSRFDAATDGLPSDNPAVTELVSASRERARVRDALIRSQIGGLDEAAEVDAALVPMLTERLAGIVRRLRDMGGVIRDG